MNLQKNLRLMVFSGCRPDLRDDINDWFRRNALEIKQINFTVNPGDHFNGDFFTAFILYYERKPEENQLEKQKASEQFPVEFIEQN